MSFVSVFSTLAQYLIGGFVLLIIAKLMWDIIFPKKTSNTTNNDKNTIIDTRRLK